jgi:hypothetical protein
MYARIPYRRARVVAAAGTRFFERAYPGEVAQMRRVRADLAEFAADCPVADDLALLASDSRLRSSRDSRSSSAWEAEDFGLLLVELALLGELVGLDLEHLGLVADLLGLFAERADRVDGRDDGEHRKDRGCHGGQLGREDERHGRSVEPADAAG